MKKDKGEIIKYLSEVMADLLERDIKEVDIDCNLNLYGLDSILALRLVNVLEDDLNIQLDPSIVLDNSSISSLGDFLYQNRLHLSTNS